MDKDTTYFISLLSAFVNGQEPQQEENINWEQVFKISRIHSVSGIFYIMAKKLKNGYEPHKTLLDKIKMDFNSTLLKSIAQDNEIELIIDKLNKNKIPHVFMKGFVVKNYYPIKEMRTMGDIDFLINPEDREKTHKIIKEIGFKVGKTPENHHWDYTLGTVHIEVHTQIMYDNISNGVDYVSYFSDIWNHAKKSKGYTYELTEEYHFLFLLVHMAKHFNNTGCGIRMIMDIAMYLLYFENRLDWNYIKEEIEKLELVTFSKNIFVLCNLWFGIKFTDKLPRLDESFYKELSQYILSAGTFGFYQRNTYTSTMRKNYADEKGVTKLRLYRNACFPSSKNISKDYLFLKDRPFLLPAAWIHRAFCNISTKGKSPFKTLASIEKIKRESEEQYGFISKLGL